MFEPNDFFKLIIGLITKHIINLLSAVIKQPHLYKQQITAFEAAITLFLATCMALVSILFCAVIKLVDAPYKAYCVPLIFLIFAVVLFKEHRRIFNSYTL